MRKIRLSFNKIVLILFYILLGAILIKHSYSYLDPDLGWHLQTGKEILSARALPGPNHNDYTIFGQPWVDHEWLANAGLYFIYERFGYAPINIIFAGLILLVIGLLNTKIRSLSRLSEGGMLILLAFEFFAVVAAAPHFGVRLQEISVLGLLLTLLIVERYQQKNSWPILLWLLPLFWLWASLHGGFPIGIAAIFIIAGTQLGLYLLRRFKKAALLSERLDFSESASARPPIRLLIGGLGATLATFLTPYGLKLYAFLGGYRHSFYLSHIQEWLPQWDFPYNYSQIIYLSLVLLAISLCLIFSKKQASYRLKPSDFILIIFFWLLAIKSRRHLPLLLVASWPFIINFFISFLGLDRLGADNKKSWNLALFFLRLSLVFSLLAISAQQVLQSRFYRDPFAYAENYGYPNGAVEFLKNHPEYDSLKLLNEFGWGGFLIWTDPDRQLFIDGRLPQYPYDGHSLLEEYWDFSQTDKIASQLDKHRIGLVLMRYPKFQPIKLNWLEKNFLLINEDEINKNEGRQPLIDYLNRQTDWKLIFADKNSVIYQKYAAH